MGMTDIRELVKRLVRAESTLDDGEKACFYVIVDGTTLCLFDLKGISVGRMNFSRE